MAKKNQPLTPKEKLAQALVPQDQQPYALPKGWVWTRLGNITKVVGGGTPKSNVPGFYENGNIAWICPADLSGYKDKYISHGSKDITQEGLDKSSAQLMPPNTVLLSSRAPIGYVAIAKNDISTNQGFKSFLPSPYFLPDYLYWYLRGNTEILKQYASGTTFLELSKSKAEQILFPLPPLPEQQRIVARIESLFAKLDAAREKLQQVLDTQEARRAAILHEAFTGRMTGHKGSEEGRVQSAEGSSQNPEGTTFVPKGWKATSAKDLFQYVTSGSRGWAKYYADNGALFIRMGNLKHGTIQPDFTDKQYVQLPDKAEGQRSLVQDHDILISITADVGMIGYIEHIEQEAYINQHIALARPVHPEQGKFIAWYLVSDIGFQQLKRKQRGATKVGLGLDDIRNLILYMPPMEEQKMIVDKIETLLEKEKAIHDIAQSTLSQIDLLKKSILARAFRGQLGTQDPSDPDARELLL